MDLQELELRVSTIETALKRGKKRRKRAQTARAWHYWALSRVAALVLAYPFLVLFLWALGSTRPWLHAFTPSITVFVYVFAAPYIKRLLLRLMPVKREEEREEEA